MALTVGLSAANLADAWLNTLRGGGAGTTFTAPAAVYVQLHTGIPGAAGTTSVSSVTTRSAITFAAAAANGTVEQIASSNTPSWATWAGTNGEVVTHVSLWSASSAGTFYCSIALTASKTMGTGDTLNLTSGGTIISLSPIAAT
jgi:hypothetical protein